ncbi:MAG: TonB-dependent receptor [Arcobacter sp.]|nr:MAG: TonB-dependent receptor [Arcobacter sp.]
MKKIVNKVIALSLVLSPILMAETVEMAEVEINESVNSVKINDISGEELKSADLAESLTRSVPSISLVRRSGIANDIILRGQKKDNINILADGTKIYGACPNRMDPATSHILTNNIESVEVKEGPYDVENFGTLSGLIDIKTKAPNQEVSGEVNLNAGSWNYRKASATVSGGNEYFRLLLSASKESSDQYEDGDGNTFADQIDNYIAEGLAVGGLNAMQINALKGTALKDTYRDMEAYDKKSFMGKVYFNPSDNQELMFSYTANRSDDILYPSSKMDALYDDSNIYNFEYSIRDMGSFSKELDFQIYHSEVDHPMSTKYRVSSSSALDSSLNDSDNESISKLSTDMDGIKLKNLIELGKTDLTVGLDASRRNWDGTYIGYGTKAGQTGKKSIDDVDTDNIAFFTRLEHSFGNLDLDLGFRYDDTTIDHGGDMQDNDYKSVSAYVFTTYNADAGMQYFMGAGKATRVPDARELYFASSSGAVVGTNNLNQTKNYEIDLGFKKQFGDGFFKTKIFHSWLKDFIVYNASKAPNMMTPSGTYTNTFENVDATIYGIEVSGFYAFDDSLSVDAGMAYQRGQKDEALENQTDTNLAEIPPLKLNVALNYDTDITSSKIELIAADKWSNFDEENGEQAIAGYAIVNLKFNTEIAYGFDATLGLDNIFDNTYAVSNTYKDLTLLTTGAVGSDIMLLNEPGRYAYVNLRYRF